MRKCKILFLVFFAVFLIVSIVQPLTIDESVDIEGVTPHCGENGSSTLSFKTLETNSIRCALTQPYQEGQIQVTIEVCCEGKGGWMMKREKKKREMRW